MNNKLSMYGLRLLTFAFLSLLIAGCGDGSGPSHIADDATTAPVYELVWADEFIENSPPNSGKWSYDTGYGENGWGNDEWQQYTSDPSNVNVSDGFLEITARCDSGECGKRDGSITSARIKTEDKFSIKYGNIQARIKTPFGAGMWPAFWMLGSNFKTDGWPKCGEIDIMEMSYVFWDNKTTNFTTHWFDEGLFPPGSRNFYGEEISFPEPLTDDYHVYEMDWDANRIIGKIDGQTYYTNYIEPDTMEEFLNDFFIILNVGVGGSLGGVPDPGPWEYTMSVDWVRVYEKVASPAVGIYSENFPEQIPGYDRIVNSIEFGGNLATPDTLSTGVTPSGGSTVLQVDFADADRFFGGIFFRYDRADISDYSTLVFSLDPSEYPGFDGISIELKDTTDTAASVPLSDYPPTSSGNWDVYEIPLNDFPGVDLTDIFLINFVNPVNSSGVPIFSGTLYLDEIYLRTDPCTAEGTVSFNTGQYSTTDTEATINVVDRCAASSSVAVDVDNGVETISVDLWIKPDGHGEATLSFGATDEATDTIEIFDGDILTASYVDANDNLQTDAADISDEPATGSETAGIYSETHTDPVIPYIGIINGADFGGNQTIANENSTAVTPYDGSVVLSIDFQNTGATYGGAIFNFDGVDMSAYSSLKFAIDTSEVLDYADLVVQLEDGSAAPNVFLSAYTPSVSGNWLLYEIPLADFGGVDLANITLLGFWNLSSTTGSVTLTYGTIYLDNIHLQATVPPTPSGEGAGVYSETHTDPVIPYIGIINGADFGGNQTIANENSTAVTPYDGSVVLSIDFQNTGATYGGAIFNFDGVDMSAYSSLKFAIDTSEVLDYADLVVQLEDGSAAPNVFLSAYTPSVSGNWLLYEIPLADFGGVDLANITLLGFWNLSSTTGSVTLTYGTIYLDDIYLQSATPGTCTTPGSVSLDSASYADDATSATITFADVCAADTLVTATVSSGGAMINIGVMLDAGGDATKILNFGPTDEPSSTIAIADGDTLMVTYTDASSNVQTDSASITASGGGDGGTGATGETGGPYSVDFDGDPGTYILEDFGGTSSELVPDPLDATNTVVKVTKSDTAELWAGTTFVDGTIVYPFTATDTTITVRVYSPDAGIPVRLKAEDSLDTTRSVETETVTTTANGWETLTFDFSNEATGTAPLNLDYTYDKLSIFFNFGTTGADAGEKVYYFDTVEFVSGGGTTTEPTTAAPTPTEDLSAAVSVFSDATYDVAGTNFDPDWGQATDATIVSIDSNDTLKYAGLTFQGTQFASALDVSGKDTMHLDFWTADATAVNISLISTGPVETAYALPISTGSWVSVDIPLSSFSEVDLADVIQLKVDDATTGESATIFFDNIYFYTATAPATEPTTAAPTPTEDLSAAVSVFSDATYDVAGTNFDPDWGQATDATIVSIDSNDTLKYAGLTFQGTQFASALDVSGKDTMHLDFWTADATAVNISLISTGPVETAYALPISTGSWVSVDIPLSSFSEVDLADVIQLKVDDATTGESATIFFDNIYFYTAGGSGADAYIYSTAGTVDIITTLADWGTGTTQNPSYSLDATYNPCLELTGGTWGAVAAFTGLPAGTLADYANLEFKIKSSEATVKVKIPEHEQTFNIADGTPLAGGWTQMSVSIASFTIAPGPSGATEFAIFGTGGATLYLTDIVLTGAATPPEPITDPTVAATDPGDLSSAVVLYSDAKTADANIITYLADWSLNIAQTEVQINTDNALRYVATSSGGPGVDGSGVAGIVLDQLNVSSQANVHMDFYVVGDVDLLKIKFVSADLGVPAGYASMLDNYTVTVKNNWFSIDMAKADIPLAPGAAGIVDWAALEQIVFITYGPDSTIDEPTRYYLDNIYFY